MRDRNGATSQSEKRGHGIHTCLSIDKVLTFQDRGLISLFLMLFSSELFFCVPTVSM